MSRWPRRLVSRLKFTREVAVVALVFAATVGLPILAPSSATASGSPGTTMNEDVGVTLIEPPTTTSTTVATKVSTAPPATTTPTRQHPVILVTSPNTATAPAPAPAPAPTIAAFTGAPITSEVILAAVLIGAGCALLVGARLFRRRRTHTA